jgi:hypothetical protein
MQWRAARAAAETRWCTGLSGTGTSPSAAPVILCERDDRWRDERALRQNCERLRGAEHEIQDRLAYTPDGEEREGLQYRLGEIH